MKSHPAYLVIGFVVSALRVAACQDIDSREQDVLQTVHTGKSVFTISVRDEPATGFAIALKETSESIYLLDVKTESASPPKPGTRSQKVFRFFTNLTRGTGKAVFVRFRPFDFAGTKSEETYEIEIEIEGG